jgi:hypothetical protein
MPVRMSARVATMAGQKVMVYGVIFGVLEVEFR